MLLLALPVEQHVARHLAAGVLEMPLDEALERRDVRGLRHRAQVPGHVLVAARRQRAGGVVHVSDAAGHACAVGRGGVG